jgi:hypothetical protein
MVLNGYFAACAATVAVKALKSVDLPTFGNPTIPHLKPMLVTRNGWWDRVNEQVRIDEAVRLRARHKAPLARANFG